MMPARSTSSTTGRFYAVAVDRDGEVCLRLADGPISEIEVVDGCLVSDDVVVSTRAVLVHVGADDSLHGGAVEPIEPRDGALCFDPSQGGVRPRENRRARGAFNHIVAEANWFGMVNAYVHSRRAARTLNDLLIEVGGPMLPRLHVVVGAHSGSQLPGYASGDGDRRSRELRPLSGGHYRLSTRTSGVPELVPVDAEGEMHLGPSRYRKPFAGSAAYLRNAAHNPAIVYHEFGHHLCRHTADFRLNAERAGDKQRNGKTGIEEGVSDYFSAVLLGSGRPYGWYRADRGRRRDPEMFRHASTSVEGDDPHGVGAIWASAWWRARLDLVADGHLRSEVDHDRVMLRALLAVGRIAAGGKRSTRTQRESLRSSRATMRSAYLEAVREDASAEAADVAAVIMDAYGLGEDCDEEALSTC